MFLTSLFFLACNQTEKKTFDEHADHGHEAELAQQESSTESLTLNNGVKWKADQVTNTNVSELKTIADNFKAKPNPTTEDYQALNGEFGRGLNKMIQQCTMEGPDHDMLHKWLEPVLKENAQLKELSSAADSKKVFDSIDKRLNDYQNYFE